MLDPQDRRPFLDLLRPPAGYSLDKAVGTTYSLDLLTLLVAPLAFTLFDWSDDAGRTSVDADPLSLLEALRRYANRISIFCHAGRIAVPRHSQRLFAYLEDSVFEVTPRAETGVFHPKVLVLRFTGSEQPVRYRLLVMSRNLTFDRSWDVVVALDGELVDRKYAFGRNHPLGDFVAELPLLALRPLPERVRSTIDRVQYELRRVRFEPPEGFRDVGFVPLGIRGHRSWPFRGRVDRMLIISPFISQGCLRRLTAEGRGHILVSRLESLDALDRGCLDGFSDVYAFHEVADPAQGAGGVRDASPGAPDQHEDALLGLHAKVYVADAGWDARVLTGSANATGSAFGQNVEFMVELTGKRSRCGVDAVLRRTAGETDFVDLLQQYTPPAMEPSSDPVQEELDKVIEGIRRALAGARLRAKVLPAGTHDEYNLSLGWPGTGSPILPPQVHARCWPVTLPESAALRLAGGEEGARDGAVVFGPLSTTALTSFFAFHLEASADDRKASARFVLNLDLEGAPDDRRRRLLRTLLEGKRNVLRYLLLLLTEDAPADARAATAGSAAAPYPGVSGARRPGAPLFEALVRALDRDPAKLDRIAELIEDLKNSPKGRDLLPGGFETVWRPIWSARRRLDK